MAALDPEDIQLARECRAGSLPAYDRLVAKYHARVFAFLLTLTRHRHDAEDLTQETFLRAWRKFDRYDSKQPLLPWLFTIARRLSISMLRKRKPMPTPEPEQVVLPVEQPDTSIWRLAEAQLSREAFTALWLHYHDELPLAQVGKILGKREGAVKVMLHRARKTLAGHLQQMRNQPPPLPATPPPLPSIWNSAQTTP
ncbi:RNA polymerase sigma factor [Haloferula rosea]|uniref:RNA polymerase sigma factor n=1 Tax=Haloferula rosea TaxID=490093 RepID=A0A934RFD8_9BACT|nr:RNA polymerase sigma factor [Haloferula rosea]MBK1828613.1 RNA polymerase sigma factor [Haloferula rosea]